LTDEKAKRNVGGMSTKHDQLRLKLQETLRDKRFSFAFVPPPDQIAALWATPSADRKPLRAVLSEVSLQVLLDAGMGETLGNSKVPPSPQVLVKNVEGLQWDREGGGYMLNLHIAFPGAEAFSPSLFLSAHFRANQTGEAQFCAAVVPSLA
jgi:hypothetical protein